jgi:hypothetical protein
MEIQGLDPLRRKKDSEAPRPAARAKESFSAKLQEVEDLQVRETLEKMLVELERLSGELERKPNKENLKGFRKGVGGFLDEVLKRAYRVEESMSLAPGGKTKIHLKVENINKAMDDLADLVMRDQAEPLLMLKKLDEIRGLIKDIYK